MEKIIITPNSVNMQTCREDVVQGICDVLTKTAGNNSSPLLIVSRYRLYLKYEDGKPAAITPETSYADDSTTQIFRCELEMAIKLLLAAGYYLYEYENHNWVCGDVDYLYKLSNRAKPFEYYTLGGEKVLDRIPDERWYKEFNVIRSI